MFLYPTFYHESLDHGEDFFLVEMLKLGEELGRSRQRLAAFARDVDRRLQEGPSADARNIEAAIASVPLLQVKTVSACISVGLRGPN